jgi:predicted GIY-YIG superfamily endonuclease
MQSRLFADAKPLVERLGRDFFLQLPQDPGVYLMRDRAAQVLYVGKAKNLRKRVCSYRVANPERMARRTLRLLGLVENIEWEVCSDELTALRRESELLLSLKPKFNRAGVWQGPKRYLAWRYTAECLEISVTETSSGGWQTLGPLGSKVHLLRAVLVRLIWFATHPALGMSEMPVGWIRGQIGNETAIALGNKVETVTCALLKLSHGDAHVLCDWVRGQMNESLHLFSFTAVELDLELLSDLVKPRKQPVLIDRI